MIELAGGTYSLNGYVPEEENALSTLKMQMEDFYAAEKMLTFSFTMVQ